MTKNTYPLLFDQIGAICISRPTLSPYALIDHTAAEYRPHGGTRRRQARRVGIADRAQSRPVPIAAVASKAGKGDGGSPACRALPHQHAPLTSLRSSYRRHDGSSSFHVGEVVEGGTIGGLPNLKEEGCVVTEYLKIAPIFLESGV